MKLINNAMLAANMGIAHAAFDCGAALGVDRGAMATLINPSPVVHERRDTSHLAVRRSGPVQQSL